MNKEGGKLRERVLFWGRFRMKMDQETLFMIMMMVILQIWTGMINDR